MYAINLGITIAKNGEPREGKYNFWVELISTCIMFILMYWAGTFDKLLNLN